MESGQLIALVVVAVGTLVLAGVAGVAVYEAFARASRTRAFGAAKQTRLDRALVQALKLGDVEGAIRLLAEGADVNAKDGFGMTPLHWAARWGYKAVAELLLDKGADVNAVTNSGKTALQLAEKEGHTDIVALLKQHGAEE